MVISYSVVHCAPLGLITYYNLVPLIFGTTIPTSFNILNEMFFTLVYIVTLMVTVSTAPYVTETDQWSHKYIVILYRIHVVHQVALVENVVRRDCWWTD